MKANLSPALSFPQGEGETSVFHPCSSVAKTTLPKPRWLPVPMEQGRHWRGGGDHLFQQKMDGIWWPVRCGEFGLITEKMRDGTLWAHTLTHLGGQDLSNVPLRETMPELRRIFQTEFRIQNSESRILLVPEFSGGEGLEKIWSDGGEGGMAKRWDLPWTAGGFKCKRLQVFYVVVLEKHAGGKSSVRVGGGESIQNSEFRIQNSTTDLGWVPLHGIKFDRCRVGSVLKLEAFGLTAAGKLREARPCKDSPTSWLLKV